jgi:hypothetical protein
MMFAEGLDESAISWIQQGTDSPAPAVRAPPWLPLAEQPPLGQVAVPPRSLALHDKACGAGVGFFSPKGLSPVRTTGSRHSVLLSEADSNEGEDGEEKSVTSWGCSRTEETADEACCSDSSLPWRAMDRCGGGWDKEVTSQLSRNGSGIVVSSFAAGKCSSGTQRAHM